MLWTLREHFHFNLMEAFLELFFGTHINLIVVMHHNLTLRIVSETYLEMTSSFCHHGVPLLHHTPWIATLSESKPDLGELFQPLCVNSRPFCNISGTHCTQKTDRSCVRPRMLPDTVFLSKLILRKAGGEKWNFLNTDPRVSPAAVSTNTSIGSNLIAGIWTARGQKNKRHFPNTNLLKRKNSIYALPARYCFTEQLGLHFSPNTGLSDPGNPHHWARFNTARSSDRRVTGGDYDDLGIGTPSTCRTSFLFWGESNI